jgi:hypothetical protein
MVVDEERWPVAWKGGQLVELFKGKGDACDCDAYRGLTVQDHMAKTMVGILKEDADPYFAKAMPSDQFGGVSGGGTDYPSHLVSSMLYYAKFAALSVFILFLDLEKA